MFWGLSLAAAIVVAMVTWSLLEIRRVDRIRKRVDQRLWRAKKAAEEKAAESPAEKRK